LFGLLITTTCHALVPQQINFSGRLTDSNGIPANGNKQFTFEFYSAITGGTKLNNWTETQVVQVINGVYSVIIGTITPIPYATFDGDTRYLEISVAGEALTPRMPIVSVPYAYMSEKSGLAYGVAGSTVTGSNIVDGTITTSDIGTGAVTSPKIKLITAAKNNITTFNITDGNAHLIDALKTTQSFTVDSVVIFTFQVETTIINANEYVSCSFTVDNVPAGISVGRMSAVANNRDILTGNGIINVAAGSHEFCVQVMRETGTGTVGVNERCGLTLFATSLY
jgi:hypothetical protein